MTKSEAETRRPRREGRDEKAETRRPRREGREKDRAVWYGSCWDRSGHHQWSPLRSESHFRKPPILLASMAKRTVYRVTFSMSRIIVDKQLVIFHIFFLSKNLLMLHTVLPWIEIQVLRSAIVTLIKPYLRRHRTSPGSNSSVREGGQLSFSRPGLQSGDSTA
jgi:hypothetical protein